MHYAYESGGRVSRPINDYRSEVLSGSFAARDLNSFWFTQGPAIQLQDIGGTLAQYSDRSIYNLVSQRSGLGVLSGAQTSQQQVPEGYVLHQAGPIYTWTTDELGGNTDANRIFQPAPSRLLFFNNAEETKSYSYHPAIIDLYTEVDFGSITANATTVSNNGQVADLNATLVDYGRIYYVTNVESFGFSKTLNAASWKACSAWVGEGNLISFGKQTSPAVYGIITDGKVRLSGTADVNYSPAPESRGILPLQGDAYVLITADITGSGNLNALSGTAESVAFNPDEKQMLFSFTGERSSEKITNDYVGDGTLFNLSNVITRRSYDYVGSGTINLVSAKSDQTNLKDIADLVLEDIKGRLLSSFKWEPSDEKKTDDYNESSKVIWSTRDFGGISVCNVQEIISGDVSGQAATGCTLIIEPGTTARVVLGQTYQTAVDDNAPSEIIDWGTITFPAAMSQDWGNILDQELRPQGLIRFDEENGAAAKFQPNWIGRGGVKVSGVATLPVFANERGTGILHEIRGAAITNFSLLQPASGLFRITSQSEFSIGVEAEGSGTFRKFNGAAESLTFNPTETQMLFSFAGGYSSLAFTHGTWVGSGRLRNFATLEAEKGTFDYVGSGEINLRSDKPEQLDLKKLADTKLSDIRNRWLGSLAWELSDEKHTENYNFSAFVPSVDLDYGLIVDPNNVVVTTITTQTVTSDETGATGVIRVGLNEVVTLAATYTIPSVASIPSATIDYGLVSDIHSPTNDYGWILGTHAHGIPFGTVADITGTAGTPRVRTHVADGSGFFHITGKALLPLFASVFGGGLFKPQGASKTNFSLLAIGDGHINGMYGEGADSISTEYFGDGTFRKISGAADSATFNPEEKQMLFSFSGAYSSLSFTHGVWQGDGSLFNIGGGGQRVSYDYVGSGSLLTFNKLEEARTYFYNCSSIVPFLDLDYGLVVDSSSIPITDLSTQTISSDETATTGIIRVGLGEVVTLGATYTLPSAQTVPTDFIDYNLVNESEDELLNFGHILDSVQVGMPACIYGTIEVRGAAKTIFFPNLTGSGLYTLSGSADQSFVPNWNGSGDLFAFSGAGEILSVAIEGTGLFRISDSADPAIVKTHIGSGTFRKLSGAAESATFNPLEKQMLFSFIGTCGFPGITLAHEGSGNLFAFDGSGERETNAWYGSGTITLTSKKPRLDEPSEEKHTEVYDLNIDCYQPEYDYGSLVDAALVNCTPTSGLITTDTTASSGCAILDGTFGIYPGSTYTIPVFANVPSSLYDYGTVPDPAEGTLNYGWILDPLGKHCPFGQIHHIRGNSVNIRTFSEVFTGESEHKVYGINISGDAEIVVPPQWYGYGVLDVTSREISITGFSLRTFGSGRLFGMGGGAESVSVSEGGQVLFKFVPGPFDRWTTYDWQPSWVTRGFIRGATGEANIHYVPHVEGTGYIPVFNGAAESITVNPDERQLLFSFTGEHQVSFTANPPEDTARVKVGSLADTRFIPKYPGDGQILTSGIANIHYVPHVIGTGFIPVFNGVAESITVNPEEKQMLFSFIGERLSEKKSVREIGSGDILVTGLSTQLLTFAEKSFGTTSVFGDGHVVASLLHIGSGTFRKFGGGAESTTFNPEERQLLFSFTGELSEARSVAETGSGILFGFSGASIAIRSAYETQGLYKVSGEGRIGFSLTHFGSGTFRKFAGAAESLTVNPDERQMLFSFLGEGSESASVSEIKQVEVDITGKADPVLRTHAFHGSGTIPVSGEANIHYVPHVIGSGTFRKFAGAAESLTVNPEEKQMLFSFLGEGSDRTTVREISKGGTLTFSGTSGDPLLTFAEQPFVQTKISGKVAFTVHRSIFGTGSLFGFGGAAEAIAIVPEPSTILFQTSGESELRVTRSYVGSGSFRKLSGAAESVTFNPDEKQLLFSFTGAGSQSKTAREIGQGRLSTTGEAGVLVRFAHDGEGTIPISGDAHTTRARDFVGFGTIPTLSGAAESISFNPDEKDLLFSFYGTRVSEKSTFREISQGGILTVGSTSGDPLLTFAEQPTVEIDITGDSYDIRTRAYQGSGRISNVNNLDEAFALAPYIGSGIATITGKALVQVQLFQPPHVQVWII